MVTSWTGSLPDSRIIATASCDGKAMTPRTMSVSFALYAVYSDIQHWQGLPGQNTFSQIKYLPQLYENNILSKSRPRNIYLQKAKTLFEKDKCNPMFITVLFVTANIWKQPKPPSTDGLINKMWYIYNRIPPSHKKRRKHRWTWRTLF